MSETLEKAAAILCEKLDGKGIDAVVKFVIGDEGAVVVDANQSPPAASIGDGHAEVTITAEADVFQELLAGELNPTTAYMSGKLKIDGSMSIAMKLASALA